MKGSKIYNVGIYIRLSREDEDKRKWKVKVFLIKEILF